MHLLTSVGDSSWDNYSMLESVPQTFKIVDKLALWKFLQSSPTRLLKDQSLSCVNMPYCIAICETCKHFLKTEILNKRERAIPY